MDPVLVHYFSIKSSNILRFLSQKLCTPYFQEKKKFPDKFQRDSKMIISSKFKTKFKYT